MWSFSPGRPSRLAPSSTTPCLGGSTIKLNSMATPSAPPVMARCSTADADGVAGGDLLSTFTTVSRTPLPNTTITGVVVGPGVDLKPMTFGRCRAGADGALHTSDDEFLEPIANARVFILGLEDQAVFTDAQGRFTLTSVPGGVV